MMSETNQVNAPQEYERLEAINKELRMIRHVLDKPDISPEIMDLVRLSMAHVHNRYVELAHLIRPRTDVR